VNKMVFWRETEVVDDIWLELPVFRVKELDWILGLPPTTIRTWIQRYWLYAHKDREGYTFSLLDFAVFLDRYGDRVRSLSSTDVKVLLPERYWPKDLPS
jgi:hypothetical protein